MADVGRGVASPAVTVSSDGTILYGDNGWNNLGGVISISIRMDYFNTASIQQYEDNGNEYCSQYASQILQSVSTSINLNLDSTTSAIPPEDFVTCPVVSGETIALG